MTNAGIVGVLIRPERGRDRPAVHVLNAAAFDSPAEADLVDRLRQSSDYLALVAKCGGRIVGHIAFTPVVLSSDSALKLAGLAPLAVAATHRRRGIGSALVRAGLVRCRQAGFGAAVVLGDPAYYSRFGFRPGATSQLTCEYAVPVEAFMAIELQPGFLDAKSGMVSFHSAFADV